MCEATNLKLTFFLASPCKTDVVVTVGECYVLGYKFSNNSKEGPVPHEGYIINAESLSGEISKQTMCIEKAARGLTGILLKSVEAGTFGNIDLSAGAWLHDNALPCDVSKSQSDPPTEYLAHLSSGPVQVGCKVPCIQVEALSNKKNYDSSTTYNFCTYNPKEVGVYEALAAYTTIALMFVAPEALGAAAGISAGTASFALSGSRLLIAGGSATKGTEEKIHAKWPGEPGKGATSTLEDILGFGADSATGMYILIKSILSFAYEIISSPWESAKGLGSAIGGGVTSAYESCTGNKPIFEIQYYSDEELTKSLGDNPHLKPGTYYLKITTDQALKDGKLKINISAEGDKNSVPEVDAKLVSLFDPKENAIEVYQYTRVITPDTAATGKVLEEIFLTATTNSGTFTDEKPANFESKRAYIDKP